MGKPIEEMTIDELVARIIEVTGSKTAAKRLIRAAPDPPKLPKPYNQQWEAAAYRRWLVFNLRLFGHKPKAIAGYLGRTIVRVRQDLDQCKWERSIESDELLHKMFGPNAWFAMDEEGRTYIQVDGRPLSAAAE